MPRKRKAEILPDEKQAKQKGPYLPWPAYTKEDYVVCATPAGVFTKANEVWKIMPNLNGKYFLSSLGRMVSHYENPRLLKNKGNTNLRAASGYIYPVTLRIVMGQAFLDAVPYAGAEVDKIDKSLPYTASNITYNICYAKDGEQWKESSVKGYEISTFGRVRSMNTGREMKPGKREYNKIKLNGKQLNVHGLAAEAFLEPPPDDGQTYTVNHKDGQKRNNKLENLEWQTPSGQALHAIKTGLRRHIPVPITATSVANGTVQQFKSVQEAAKFAERSVRTIRNACHNVEGESAGYLWRYATPQRQRQKYVPIEGEVFNMIPANDDYPELAGIAISTLARIKSVDGTFLYTPTLKPNGYYLVQLGGRMHPLSRLVGYAFHGFPQDENAEADHINRKTTDNRPQNIRWSTENNAAAHGIIVKAVKQDTKEEKLFASLCVAGRFFETDHGTIHKWAKKNALRRGWIFSVVPKPLNALPQDLVGH